MSIIGVLLGIFLKKEISVTEDLGTGYDNPRNKEKLIKVQDSVWASGAYMPTYDASGEVTHCNGAVNAVLGAYDYKRMSGMVADEMMAFLRTSGDFRAILMVDAQFRTNMGTVVVAGLDSKQLGQSHGHVCTLTPGEAEWSGHWNAKAPVCLSLGRKGICFRSKGVNWAFVGVPEFYAWVPTL